MDKTKAPAIKKRSHIAATVFGAFGFYILNSSMAYATMCQAIATMTTGSGNDLIAAIATIGVLGIGIGATFGRVTWGQAALVAVGIATISSAATVASYFGAGC